MCSVEEGPGTTDAKGNPTEEVASRGGESQALSHASNELVRVARERERVAAERERIAEEREELAEERQRLALRRERLTEALEVRRLRLQAVGYDARDDVFEVAVARDGAHMPGVFHRLVDHPRRIESDSHTLLAPMTIAVGGQDGLRMVIMIDSWPEFAG